MFGLGFLNSVFLAGLAAMALPIVIHILNRRRLRKVPFSSLQFIFELSRRRMSKVNFRRWLILLLRTLAVMLLVMAFARPTIQSNAALFLPGDVPKNVVLCIDMSASMAAELRTGTAFTTGQDIAKRVIDEAGGNDVFNVVTYASRADVLFENGTRNKQVAKNAIGDLSVGFEKGTLGTALTAAIDIVKQSELSSGEIYVISDFRESPDSVVVSDAPKGVRIVLLPVYDEAIDNAGIDRVFTPRKLIRPGEIVRLGVAVTNHSRMDPVDFPLELFVDGKRKAEKVVSLAPASSANVTFSVSLNDWGRHRCRVSKNRDRLPTDDDRYFLLEVSRKIPVTLVRGRKFVEGTDQAAGYFYVDKALNPRGSGEGEFSVESIDEKELTAANLPSNGVVVWTEPQDPGRNRLELLERHVRAGGPALIFLGYDRKGLWKDPEFARYLGIQKATPKEREDGERFVSFQKDHPVFSIFSEEELELLSRSRIRRFLSVSGVAPDSVIAYMAGGDPGIWECRRGTGRIIVVAATPDMPSGDLPLSPMFLPFIHTAVTYLASTDTGEMNRENMAGVDLFFELPSDWRTRDARFTAVDQKGDVIVPVLFESSHGEPQVMVSRPRDVGYYTLLADSTVITEAAVNIDPFESNLNPQTLDQRYLGAANVIETSEGFVANLKEDKQGREIYVLFLLLAVSALVAEAMLGRRA